MTSEFDTPADIRRFVLAERARSVSDREWRFRLAGYGYQVVNRAGADVLATLPQGQEVCALGY